MGGAQPPPAPPLPTALLDGAYIKSNFSVLSNLECGHFCLNEKCSGFNHKLRKKKNEINCQLTRTPAISDLPTIKDESWDFYQVQNDSMHQVTYRPIITISPRGKQQQITL
jgi:hypothetical protein